MLPWQSSGDKATQKHIPEDKTVENHWSSMTPSHTQFACFSCSKVYFIYLNKINILLAWQNISQVVWIYQHTNCDLFSSDFTDKSAHIQFNIDSAPTAVSKPEICQATRCQNCLDYSIIGCQQDAWGISHISLESIRVWNWDQRSCSLEDFRLKVDQE